jgi:hypothetical protein
MNAPPTTASAGTTSPSLPPAAAIPWAARRVRHDWLQLGAATLRAARFDPAMVADLPEPARRYLTHVIAAGTSLWQSVQVSMVGQIKLRTWCPFTAGQVVAPGRGYIWAARTRLFGLPIVGYDRLSAGTAEMRWRLLDLLPVVTARGHDTSRSAAGRLASEIVMIPTGFPSATWGASGPDTAVAVWGTGAEQQRVELRLGPDGRLEDLVIQRWGNPDGRPFGRYPFGVTVEAERTDGGITTPAVVRAGWWHGSERQGDGEFFRARITSVTFR